MSERFKYSLNGVYRCENFALHVARNRYRRVPIGSAGGVNGWFITLQTTNNQNNNLTRRCYISAPKCGPNGGGPIGEYMNIADLLNQDNGYLDDDGILTVEYGIHVDGILGDDGWKFNFEDQLFDGEEISWKLQEGTLHSHKQFFNIDASEVQVPNKFNINAMKMFLQVAHGVRLNLDSCWLFKVIEIAHHYKQPNVLKYCEYQLIEKYRTLLSFILKNMIRIATEMKLDRWMGHCVRSVKRVKDIDWDIENMSGEAMKMLAARIFEHGK
ncbi:unnamed protein product [Caenorhabditis brenneri]